MGTGGGGVQQEQPGGSLWGAFDSCHRPSTLDRYSSHMFDFCSGVFGLVDCIFNLADGVLANWGKWEGNKDRNIQKLRFCRFGSG